MKLLLAFLGGWVAAFLFLDWTLRPKPVPVSWRDALEVETV